MNWYIYWYFTIHYFCRGMFKSDHASGRFTGLLFSFPVAALCRVPILLMDSFFHPELAKHDSWLWVTLLLLFIHTIVFWEGSKRFRKWNNTYRNTQTDGKNCFFVILSLVGIVGYGVMVIMIK